MNTVNKLLDKAREVCSSDSEIARKLNVTRSAVSKWRHGGKIEPAHLAKLLTLTQQDPAIAVQVMAEQEATPEERRMWGVVWDRLSPVTSMVAGVLLAVGLAIPYQAKASQKPQAEPLHPMCIMRSLARWLRAAATRYAARWTHGTPAVLA